MKNFIKLLLIMSILVFTAFRCTIEKLDQLEYKPIEIKKITDFDCKDCIIDLQYEFMASDTSYLIYSENDFEKYVIYRIAEIQPTIDFEKYFLIIGIKRFVNWAELKEEYAKENSSEIVYTVIIQELGFDVPTGVVYHAFIEKPVVEKNVRIELIY